MKVLRLIRVLRAHINLILGTVLVAVLATTVATKLTPHHYVATSSLLVSIDEGVHASYAESPAAQIDVLTSKIVAGAVVDRLRLVNDPLRQARFLASNESLLARLRGMRSTPIRNRVPQDTKKWSVLIDERYQLINRLLKQVKVRPAPNSNVILVSYDAQSPDAASEAANAWVAAYLDTQMPKKIAPRTETTASVLSFAFPPLQPTSPNLTFNLLLALAIGFAAGIGLALWREVKCRYVRGIDDLRELLGVLPLGVLPDSGKPALTPRLAGNHEQ